MIHRRATLKPLHKRILHAATALLWISGVVWLCLPAMHPAQPLWLKIHGAGAMAFLLIFGLIVFQHVPMGWRQGERRPSGPPLLAVSALLVFTGWALYYVGNEAARRWASWIHSFFGVLLPVFIALHVWLSRDRLKR